MHARRKIIKIDEEKCDGCGLCVPACAEGAIQIVDGKARLVSEVYCDGLGDCLGECPRGALTIEEREAEEFDEKAVEHHLAEQKAQQTAPSQKSDPLPCGCPGSASQTLKPRQTAHSAAAGDAETTPSALGNWPVQLHLVPVVAPYFNEARLVIAADCVPFSFADFHRKFLAGRVLLVGCPKLDDAEAYREKLAQIFRQNDIRSVEAVYMEVPCCFGLVHLVKKALEESGREIPLSFTKVGIHGEILEVKDQG